MKEAETNHVNYPTSFDRFLAEMQKKQSKQPGGSSKIRQMPFVATNRCLFECAGETQGLSPEAQTCDAVISIKGETTDMLIKSRKQLAMQKCETIKACSAMVVVYAIQVGNSLGRSSWLASIR
eukprot:876927-Rhodomonas_salina.3